MEKFTLKSVLLFLSAAFQFIIAEKCNITSKLQVLKIKLLQM